MKLRKEYRWAMFKALLDPTLKYFCVAVTALIIVNWSNAWFSDDNWTLYSQDLVRIFLIVFFGIFPTMMVEVFIETNSARGARTKNIVRFFITAIFVLGTYALIEPTGSGVTLGTIITFLLIYAAISVYSYFNATIIELKEKKLAEDINKRLNEIHKGENESHPG